MKSLTARLPRSLLFAAAAAGVFSLLMPFNVADRFLYFPMRYPDGDWAYQARAGAEERWVTSADGTRLNCSWYPKADSALVTLFLHGNAGNVTHRVDHAQAIQAAGSAVLVLDYRGYGKSEGSPGEAGLYADAEAAYRELQHMGYPASRIVLHGESLGTAVATDLAARFASAGLVLESPFMSVSKMAGRVVPLLGPLLARGFDTHGKIGRVRVPVLVIHGDADEVVPFSHGEAVFRRANEPKQFWRLPGGTHNTLLSDAGAEYSKRLRAFYSSLMGTSQKSPPKTSPR